MFIRGGDTNIQSITGTHSYSYFTLEVTEAERVEETFQVSLN